jgi:hypothetical protein
MGAESPGKGGISVSDKQAISETTGTPGGSQGSGSGLVEVKRSAAGWLLTLDGFTEAGAVGGYLWPGGVPAGVEIVALTVVEEPAQIGQFELTGLTMDAMSQMDPSLTGWFTQVMTSDPSDPSVPPDPSIPSDTQPRPDGLPDVTDPNFEEDFREWLHISLHGAETIIEIASYFAEAESILVKIEEFSTPIGDVLMLYDLFSAVIEAFGGGLEVEKKRGFCFGLMWDVLERPDVAWKPGLPFGDLPNDPFHSDEERADAFNEGVKSGRAKAQEQDIREGTSVAIARAMATNPPPDINWAADFVLNEFTRQVVGGSRFENLDSP